MKHLLQYYKDENASESVEKIMGIGGAVALAAAGIVFFTYQFNKAAKTGADKANAVAEKPANIQWDLAD